MISIETYNHDYELAKDFGYQQGRADERNRIEAELVKHHNDSGMIAIQTVIDIIEEVEE